MKPLDPITTAFPNNLLQLRDALSEIGISDLEICSWPNRLMLRARVPVNVGKYAGSIRGVGWSFPNESIPYPEYAPHWFHIEGNFDDDRGGACEQDYDENDNLWLARSRPIGASWNEPYRTPENLIRATVNRFWKCAK